MQRIVIANEFNTIPVHAAATAYRPSIGLAENVTPHLKNRFLLKMDFKDFFPSLRPEDFHRLLQSHMGSLIPEYSPQDFRDLTRILFKACADETNLRLAIGAPSSPHLSNILLYEIDSSIQALCQRNGIVYTRYADDLSFSTSEADLLLNHEVGIAEIISSFDSPQLKINSEKTVHTSLKRGRRITGLTISNNGEISVGRERKRKLRAEIHAYKEGKMNSEEEESLQGYISFLNSVQPREVEYFRKKYGVELIDSFLFKRKIANFG